MASPRTYVIVHGAWGHSADWLEVARGLGAAGHRVVRADLPGVGALAREATPEVNLQTHVEHVSQLLASDPASEIHLVAHSYGGLVATGAASAQAAKVARLIYVDAILPRSGESLASLRPEDAQLWRRLAEEHGDGWLVPPYWPDPAVDTPHPLASLTQPLDFSASALANIEGHYILTVEPNRSDDRFLRFHARAQRLGYRTSLLETGHNPQRTMVSELVALLLE